MEAEVVCQLFSIKEEFSEQPLDIDSGIIKKEPLDDTDPDDSMNSSRTESVDLDDFELTVEKPTLGKTTSVSDHQLFPIKNELAALDPLDINPKLIKRERIDDEDDFSIDNALPIDTIVPVNAFITKKPIKRKTSKNEQVGKAYFSQVTTVSNKVQRIGKAKTRTTSYLLWTIEMRQKMMAADPNRDYASITRQLAKLWPNVTAREKNILKRRAIRLNAQNGIVSGKSTNNRTLSLGLVDERLHERGAGSDVNEHGMPFGKINHDAGITSYSCEHNAQFHLTAFTNYPMGQCTITEVAETPLSNQSERILCRSSMRRKSLKERNADLDMQQIQNNPNISDDIKAILNGDLDNEMIQIKRRSKKIEDDDFLPTYKERLERKKMINGTRPRGRPRKVHSCETNEKQTPKKNVKSPGKNQSHKKLFAKSNYKS